MRRSLHLLLIAVLLSGCSLYQPVSGKPKVQVLYAASLVRLMEGDAASGFLAATGYRLEGVAGGSTGLAQQVRSGLRKADVFISASPAVNALLMEGRAPQVAWYATFAQAPLVLGYNPGGRWAKALQSQPWYQVIDQPGFRLGRSDPSLDPKGALTVKLLTRAAAYYREPDLTARTLGDGSNIFPEEALVGRLQAGQLDASFFYENEAVEQNIPFIRIDPALALKATYTITILRDAPNPAGAAAFVRYLLGPEGQRVLKAHGVEPLPPTLSGDRNTLPAALQNLLPR